MNHPKRVLIMTGGTGGHVFPGLALAEYLRTQGIDVHWLGTPKGIEARLVPEAKFPLHFISIEGLRGKGLKKLFAAPYRLTTAILQARKIIQSIRPDVIVGLGGFVSGPGGVASRWLNIPLIIHEQNAIAGLTNKILSRFAKYVLEGFPRTFTNAKTIYIGNPVREAILSLPQPNQRIHRERKRHILVLGGSLGAQALNQCVPAALAMIDADSRPAVWHQTGEKGYQAAVAHYHQHEIDARLDPFINNMAEAYAWADLVICRAGALTVAELCSVGLGAIFIPFPFAVDDHQRANAQFMVEKDAAICIPQASLDAKVLSDEITQLINHPERCLQMAQNAYGLRKDDVTRRFFDIISKTLSQ